MTKHIETLHGWHGRTDTLTPNDVRDLYLSPMREYAHDYTFPNGVLYEVTYDAANPLHLRTAKDFRAVWETSGADRTEGAFHPQTTGVFTAHLRTLGHDAVVLHPTVFDDPDADHDDWEIAVSAFGDPQTIVLNPAAARAQRHTDH